MNVRAFSEICKGLARELCQQVIFAQLPMISERKPMRFVHNPLNQFFIV